MSALFALSNSCHKLLFIYKQYFLVFSLHSSHKICKITKTIKISSLKTSFISISLKVWHNSSILLFCWYKRKRKDFRWNNCQTLNKSRLSLTLKKVTLLILLVFKKTLLLRMIFYVNFILKVCINIICSKWLVKWNCPWNSNFKSLSSDTDFNESDNFFIEVTHQYHPAW